MLHITLITFTLKIPIHYVLIDLNINNHKLCYILQTIYITDE